MKFDFCDIQDHLIYMYLWNCTDVMQSGIVPPLVPFAQTFAAVITAALTGSLYYIATAPKGDQCSTDDCPNLHEYVNVFCFFFG